MSSAPSTTTAFGRYMLHEKLGRGGMGEVWKATIAGPGGFARTLVVKRVLPHLVEELGAVELFIAEARLSAKLHHSNIVQVFEFGDVAGEAFLAMEFVDGPNLGALLRRGETPPPPGFGVFVAQQMARALAYAYHLTDESGAPLRVVHRDVSPSNVMIGADGAIKLLDFGVAKVLAERSELRTKSGVVRGKVDYMSPEQAEGAPVDHRSDLFSLGILLYEMLTGVRPFRADNDLRVLSLIRAAPSPPVPSQIRPGIPATVDRICLRLLARDPAQRYQNGDELAADLDEEVLALRWGPSRTIAMLRERMGRDEPLPAAPVAASTVVLPQSTSAPRRHRWWLAALPALALALAAAYAMNVRARPSLPVVPQLASSPTLVSAPPAMAASPTIAPSGDTPASHLPSQRLPERAPAPPAAKKAKKRGAGAPVTRAVDYRKVVDPFH